jgi:hypothetical protein
MQVTPRKRAKRGAEGTPQNVTPRNGTPLKGTPLKSTPLKGTPTNNKRKALGPAREDNGILHTARKRKGERRSNYGGRQSFGSTKLTLQIENNASVKVFARFRPQNKMELEAKSATCVTLSETTVDVRAKAGNVDQYTFTRVFDEQATQETVYNESVKELVVSTMKGFNATIIAYGQTGSGKTHTMEGIIAQAGAQIIAAQESAPDVECKMSATMVEIYNEKVNDLQVRYTLSLIPSLIHSLIHSLIPSLIEQHRLRKRPEDFSRRSEGLQFYQGHHEDTCFLH